MTGDQPTILVIDDESHILHVVSLKLINAGYRVITAEDGDEGYRAALEYHPDMIITDYQMPYRTGLELCVELKAHESTCKIPCLLLTARGFSLSRQVLEGTSIVAVMSKPFSLREVLIHVQQLVGPASAEASDAA